MSDSIAVYALYSTKEPNRIRYIGITSNPELRLQQHHYDAHHRPTRSPHKTAWILSTLEEKEEIFYRVLEMYDSREQAYVAEMWWIDHLRRTTEDLVNVSNGGIQSPPVFTGAQAKYQRESFTPKKRKQYSDRMRKQWSDPEWKQKRLKAMKNSDRMKRHKEDSKKRWDALSDEERTIRIMKPIIAKRYKKAQRNGWVLEVVA